MKQELRPYQRKALEDAREAYRKGAKSVLLVAPTGAGKTRMGVEVVSGALAKGRHVLWLAHRTELITQARDRLLAEGLERVGVIQGDRPTMNAPIQVASIQTLTARAARGLPPAGIVVFDEAHHYAAKEWREVAEKYSSVPRLGLTATPERGDGLGLGDMFDALVQVSTVRELQALGVLVPCATFAPSSYSKQLAQDPVAAHLSRAPGERTVVFCQGVTHAEKTVLAFQAQGVPAATIHGDTPPALRAARLKAFHLQDRAALLAAGYLEPAPLVLCTPFVLTEGWDCPEASCCILARGCGHPGMMLQMVGRVLRAAPGKTRAVFVDLPGVTQKRDRQGRLKIGLPEADREWSLEGKASALDSKDDDRDQAMKPCPACEAMISKWSVDRDGWRTCPICRERVMPPAAPQVQPRELHAFGSAASPEARAGALRGLARAAARRSGNRAGWVAHRYLEKFGTWPARGAAAKALLEVGVELVGPPRAPRESSVDLVEELPPPAEDFGAWVEGLTG